MAGSDQESWARVATFVTGRMSERGLSIQALADHSDLSRATVSEIVHGVERSRGATTLAPLCVALGWTTDSIDSILSGGGPTELTFDVVPGRPEPGLLDRIQRASRSASQEIESEISRLTRENEELRERLGHVERLLVRLLGEEGAREPATRSAALSPGAERLVPQAEKA